MFVEEKKRKFANEFIVVNNKVMDAMWKGLHPIPYSRTKTPKTKYRKIITGVVNYDRFIIMTVDLFA